jgi:ADP-ribose pyrophosphatase YjhB (NUDIX family)
MFAWFRMRPAQAMCVIVNLSGDIRFLTKQRQRDPDRSCMWGIPGVR